MCKIKADGDRPSKERRITIMKKIWKRICRKPEIVSVKNASFPNFAQGGWLCKADCC